VPLSANDLILTDWPFVKHVFKKLSWLTSFFVTLYIHCYSISQFSMDEIAPEYDVVVLGTGKFDPAVPLRM